MGKVIAFVLPLVLVSTQPSPDFSAVHPKPLVACYMNDVPHELQCVDVAGHKSVIA